MNLEEVDFVPAEGHQLIVGQSHFIKTVEDVYEALVASVPGIKFGVAFCEASGKALVRSDGTDSNLVERAAELASRLGAGHCFVVLLSGAFPINVLGRLKSVDEIVGIYCATANPVTFIVADVGKGRGILGVIDGISPKGKESPTEAQERREFLRKIGYKR
jgi:adenosine/AMP kinase